MLEEFSKSLAVADEVLLLPVYAAREYPTEGYDSLKLADETKKYNKNVWCLDDYQEAFFKIKQSSKQGDVVMILGAGTIEKLADKFLDK